MDNDGHILKYKHHSKDSETIYQERWTCIFCKNFIDKYSTFFSQILKIISHVRYQGHLTLQQHKKPVELHIQ